MSVLVERIVALDEALDAASIPHAFGGALALAYAVAEPRGTRDVDVNIFLPPTEAARVLRALPAGVAWSREDVEALRRDDQVRVHWDDTPLDLFFNAHRFHELAARRARLVPLAGRMIPVLDPTDLAVFKVLFDRTRDWADLEAMHEAATVDADDAAGWLEQLVGADDERTRRFRRLFAG
jgi:hypothetical protein